jgi:replication factor C small subunit
MEQYSNNCTFILTCNFKNRLIEPIHSRCQEIDFKMTSKEKAGLAGDFFKRVLGILRDEGIAFEKPVVAEVLQRYFPDFRKCLNELQAYSVGGKIDSGILLGCGDGEYEALFAALKAKKFTDMRKWVANHSDLDSSEIYSKMYDMMSNYLEPKSMPQMILTLNQYQYQSAFVANQELNTTACLTELMTSDLSWK